jgi:hypothetical protein
MEAKTLKKAISDAEQFLKIAKITYDKETDKDHEYVYGGKNTAAMKRASMDLSRTLSDMRQGR